MRFITLFFLLLSVSVRAQTPGIAQTVNFAHIKQHYYQSQRQVNPTGIVPKGPHVDLTVPHDRGRF